MALPRRTPWSSQEDYEEVFSLLFSSNGDVHSQRKGIERINVWQSRGCCPYSAEATASILAVILRDAASNGASTSALPGELRLAYAMATIRFVNGLVDPAQQGPFARSIAAIAAQIGLPLWFVELRHAATHEDLPSLQVLRDAARKALDWLYTQYWLPQMQATENETLIDSDDSISEAQKTEIRALLTQYKKLQKDALRDASIIREKDLMKAIRAVERWTLDVGTSRSGFDVDDAVTAGCQKLANILCEPGFLVPLSKKKRSGSRDSDLPEEVRSIWEPLLQHLDETFDDFTGTIGWKCVEILASSEREGTDSNSQVQVHDKSYLHTLKLWACHLVAWEDDEYREQLVKYCLLHSNTYTAFVLQAIASHQTSLLPALHRLQQVKRSHPALIAAATDAEIEAGLRRMSQRIADLQKPAGTARINVTAMPDNGTGQAASSSWSLVPEEVWRPCPFGMLYDGRQVHLGLV